MQVLTQERLKEVLAYDKSTGEFTWLKRTSERATNIVVGTSAGSINTQGYRVIWLDNKAYRASYLAFLYEDNLHVTSRIVFLNGDRADTRYSNLDYVHDLKNFELTQENLLAVLEYIPETGDFIRLVTMGVTALRGSKAGALTKANYSIITLGSNRYYAHRLAFIYMLGEIPENDVDHINGICDDNRWCNLRNATKSENLCNQKVHSDNKLGIKGVIYLKDCNKYTVTITKDGKRIYIGRFIALEEAIEAASTDREIHHDKFARHN